ncbi:DUF4430 domain-containing protein [Defluviitalea phaphyphila]|uniref:DUF4430 domain-containing protein n=1 Tax=Defluviitalea phaphyphila TaxID=1473580 RepID=UPI0007307DE0|nr:DUF4430 domain-containing protein [Defluviitalea phaphyphila]
MKKITKVLIFNLIFLILVSCGQIKDEKSSGKVNFIISKNFGNQIIDNKFLEYKENYTVIDYLEENFEIETAYGGGFVNSINGIESGFTNKTNKEQLDWFYYVNGNLANIGANEYVLSSEDVVIWDYHSWGNDNYVSNIIGAYPINFINSGLDLEIIENGDYTSEIDELKKYLKDEGLKNITVNTYDKNDIENIEINSIIIGKYKDIKNIPMIKNVFDNKENFGIFYDIEENINIYSFDRKTVETYEKGAIISSVQKEYNSLSVIWMITGNDENLIKKAIKILNENPEEIKGKTSLLITEDKIVNLPIVNN